MAEELSPESKLYVKEEIEKSRKETREDLEKVKSKTTKTFATIAMIIGLLTGAGVYGFTKDYMKTTIRTTIDDKLDVEAVKKFEERMIEAKTLVEQINILKSQAQESSSRIAEIENDVPKKIIVGTIVPYGGRIKDSPEPTEVEEGWFFCNGATLKRSDYPLLFKVIGRAFGEPDNSTFNLPDLRGRFVRGVNHGQKRDPDAHRRKASNTGGHTGDKVGSIQDDELKKHKHQWRGYRACGSGSRVVRSRDPINKDNLQDACFETGGNETRPKNIYVNWIIKAR